MPDDLRDDLPDDLRDDLRDDLLDDLFDEPRAYQFFQAVRLLEMSDRRYTPVGEGNDPNAEAVRFRSRIDFGFAAWDIDDVEPRQSAHAPPRMTVGFLGIANPASFGSLPHPYVELTQTLARRKETGLRAFLDCLNHRLISLYYRAFKKHHFAVAYERDRRDAFEDALFAVVGLGGPALRDRMHFDDRALLARCSMIGRGQASARGLRELIEDYFKVPVKIEEFAPAWYTIDEDEQYRLGDRSSRLGHDVVLGSSYRTGEFQFRVKLGPVGWSTYCSFLPDGDNHRQLIDMIRFAVGPVLDFEIQPILEADGVPPARVASSDDASRLGWSTWLTPAERRCDRDEGVFRVSQLHSTA